MRRSVTTMIESKTGESFVFRPIIRAIAGRLDPAIANVAHAEIAELRIESLLEGVVPAIRTGQFSEFADLA